MSKTFGPRYSFRKIWDNECITLKSGDEAFTKYSEWVLDHLDLHQFYFLNHSIPPNAKWPTFGDGKDCLDLGIAKYWTWSSDFDLLSDATSIAAEIHSGI